MNFKKVSRLNESVQHVEQDFVRKPCVISPGKNAILSFINKCGSVSESDLSLFINGLNETKTITSMDWVRENGKFFNASKNNQYMFISLSDIGEQILKESSETEETYFEIIGEGKLATVKRQYRDNPAKTVQIATPVRNKILSYVSENEKVTRSQFIEFLKQTNEETGRKTSFAWVRKNAHFFKVVEDKETKEKFYTLSAFGKRVLSRTTVNENVSADDVLNEDYSAMLIQTIATKLGIDIEKYDMNQLKIGMEVALMAHGSDAGANADITNDDPEISLKIVLGNLQIDPSFYTSAKPENWGKEFFNSAVTGEPETDVSIIYTNDKEKESDTIVGGKGDNMTIKDIAQKHNVSEEELLKEFEVGKAVEMEHTNDKEKAEEIAKDHLSENPKYYSILIRDGLADEKDAIALAKKLLGVEPKEKEKEEGDEKEGDEKEGDEKEGDEKKKLLTDEQKEKVKSLINEYKDKEEVPNEEIEKLAKEFDISVDDLKAYIEIQFSKDEEPEKNNENMVNESDHKPGTKVKIVDTGAVGTIQGWVGPQNNEEGFYKVLLDDGTGTVIDVLDAGVETIEEIGDNKGTAPTIVLEGAIQKGTKVNFKGAAVGEIIATGKGKDLFKEFNSKFPKNMLNVMARFEKSDDDCAAIKYKDNAVLIYKNSEIEDKIKESVVNETKLLSKDVVQTIIDLSMQYTDDDGAVAAANQEWKNINDLVLYLKDYINPRDIKQFSTSAQRIAKDNHLNLSEMSIKLGEDYKFENKTGTIMAIFEDSFLVEWENGNSEEMVFEFKVNIVGIKGNEFHITIDGHDYGYEPIEGSGLSAEELVQKFKGIMKFSAGRALAWLKKNANLVAGSKRGEKLVKKFMGENVTETEAATTYNTPGMGNVYLPGKDTEGSGDTFGIDTTIPANAGLNRKQGRYQTKRLHSLQSFIKNSLQESNNDTEK